MQAHVLVSFIKSKIVIDEPYHKYLSDLIYDGRAGCESLQKW